MKLNEKLHLVIPVLDAADKPYAYVHSAPISAEVFEAHFDILGDTFAELNSGGPQKVLISGPKTAAYMLKRIALKANDEGYPSLLNEIRRLTNVLVSSKAGWEMVPYQEAFDRKRIDDIALRDIENALVFFTATSSMLRGNQLRLTLTAAAGLWGAEISSLDFTGFAASQKTSIAAGNTGEMPTPASSVPY